jgi:hypothetical protein
MSIASDRILRINLTRINLLGLVDSNHMLLMLRCKSKCILFRAQVGDDLFPESNAIGIYQILNIFGTLLFLVLCTFGAHEEDTLFVRLPFGSRGT